MKISRMFSASRQFPVLKKFDSDQLRVTLIIGLLILCLAIYRMWTL
jgi:hypothetical protein